MQRLSIIIPAYNERRTIGMLLERVFAARFPEGWEREVIVVDDGSTDGTSELVKELRLPVRLIERAENGGKGTALVDGFREATGTHVLIQDADLEYDPEDIPALLDAIDGPKSAVYGSRNLRPGTRKGSFLLRMYVWSVTKLVNFLYGTKLTDLCTCYKLFPRDAAPLFRTGGFEADMLIATALARHGYSIKEVPISYSARTVAEGKKIKYADGIKALFAILSDYLTHRV
jgi:glycosyltransferase involved in cell wall biosynthesis